MTFKQLGHTITNLFTTLDWYIIRKFLGTFFFSIILILGIGIVFDITEKMDDFYDAQLSFSEVVLQYYIYFIPYYMNMFSPLFIFISVIFFTSKLAGNSEIIAMMSTGMSFHRLMWPYLFSSILLFFMLFFMAGYIIPPASGKLLDFTDKYVDQFTDDNVRNVQMEVEPGTILYIETYRKSSNVGYRTSLEHFDGKTLKMRITADRIVYDSCYNWHMEHYTRRDFDGMYESLTRGERLDTIIPMQPEELFITAEMAQQMTNPELRTYMERQRQRGAGNLQAFENEWHKRFASPIGAFIMTLLGVTMSCKKVRGGMGKNLGIGIALSAGYILFSTVSTSFSVSGTMSPFMAAWIPNFVFLAIGSYLYFKVQK
ncbi:MAG: LptF/LptG family permease [Paludibacteraceae bacterium]|nr:LptF/LptG family permease [Paludibacteraceae bacterium]